MRSQLLPPLLLAIALPPCPAGAGERTGSPPTVFLVTQQEEASWRDLARWENTMIHNFENASLGASAFHDKQHISWVEPPAEGKKGKRSRSLDQDSPLTRAWERRADGGGG